jgi:co-chaperonin GroES (HSP10)
MKKPNPVGHYVLVEIPEITETSDSGIIIRTRDTMAREEKASEQGRVVAIGPCAYVEWAGCRAKDRPAHEQWGIKVGDWVEFRKYEGKDSVIDGFDRYRYIPDTHIVGRVDDE